MPCGSPELAVKAKRMIVQTGVHVCVLATCLCERKENLVGLVAFIGVLSVHMTYPLPPE